jgi:hypothetical protein
MPVTVVRDEQINFDELPDKIARIACLNSVALISQRVQNQGLDSNEKSIGTYSKSWAQQRLKEGRQVQFIDLTYSGEMMDSFTFSPLGKDYVVGFSSDKEGQKADWNEERFGVIFQLSNEELNDINNEIQNGLDEYFK